MTATSDSPPANGIDRQQVFDLTLPYELHPQVEIRPEPFGALIYSFKTRRLSFLKDPVLVDVVRTLRDHRSAGAACRAAGIDETTRLKQFERALATLASTETIRERQT